MKKLSKEEIELARAQRKYHKKTLQKQKHFSRILVHFALFFLIEAIFAGIFMSINADYSEATEENTEKIVCKIDKIHRASAGRNSPYIFVSGELEFLLFNPGNSAYQFHDEIISEESVTVTVKKRVTLLGHKNIVDIRTANTVYYDISAANEFYKDSRASATLWVGFFCFAYTLMHGLIIIFEIHAYRAKKHFG